MSQERSKGKKSQGWENFKKHPFKTTVSALALPAVVVGAMAVAGCEQPKGGPAKPLATPGLPLPRPVQDAPGNTAQRDCPVNAVCKPIHLIYTGINIGFNCIYFHGGKLIVDALSGNGVKSVKADYRAMEVCQNGKPLETPAPVVKPPKHHPGTLTQLYQNFGTRTEYDAAPSNWNFPFAVRPDGNNTYTILDSNTNTQTGALKPGVDAYVGNDNVIIYVQGLRTSGYDARKLWVDVFPVH